MRWRVFSAHTISSRIRNPWNRVQCYEFHPLLCPIRVSVVGKLLFPYYFSRRYHIEGIHHVRGVGVLLKGCCWLVVQGNEFIRTSLLLQRGFLQCILSNGCRMNPNRLYRLIDSPYSWGVVGFLIGIALGVTTLSVWLVAVGLGIYLLYLWKHGPAQNVNEGWLFASGPTFMMSWVLGFVVRGLVL